MQFRHNTDPLHTSLIRATWCELHLFASLHGLCIQSCRGLCIRCEHRSSCDVGYTFLFLLWVHQLKSKSLTPAAIRSDRTDLVKLLLHYGSWVNQKGRYGRCPLHEASELGKSALVTLLLKAGAQPDPRSNFGLTPLALAAQGGHLEVMEILLSRGERARMSLHVKVEVIQLKMKS